MARLIAYFLPQYHPVADNDAWWGTGFTEWTNVTKAGPLYDGHDQPRYPTDLGYYDLRVPEVREAQAELARAAGLEGFIYYHYWFGNGRLLLERPVQDMLDSGRPDLPFCLCWANETWKGAWHGESSGRTLVEQTYPGRADYEAHFEHLLPAFTDPRYITVDGAPVFNIYKPLDLPDIAEFVDVFRTCAERAGLPGMFLVGSRCPLDWDPRANGLDGVIGSEVATFRFRDIAVLPPKERYSVKRAKRIARKLTGGRAFPVREYPVVVPYADAVEHLITTRSFDWDYYPCVMPNWDNTPRAGLRGMVFDTTTPEVFGDHLDVGLRKVEHLPEQRQLVFIKSWNEWAEGNYLEPDRSYGHSLLEEVRRRLDRHRAPAT